MAVIILTGRPGKGKTLTMVETARQHFVELNPPLKIWWLEKIRKKEWVYILNQYSDFPIIFKQERKDGKRYKYYDERGNIKENHILTSIPFRIYDLTLDKKFQEDADFYIDEIQAKYDSMEYKDFPDAIAHFCQSHRHFGNGDIMIASQSQSRIIKRILVLAEEYHKILEFKKLFNWIAWTNIRITWELANNIETNQINDEKIEVEYKSQIFFIKRIAKMYDSKYLKTLVEEEKPYKIGQYDGKNMTKNEILHTFFPTDGEKENIKNLRY